MKSKIERLKFRKTRTRTKLRQVANGRPRLSVHRTLKYLYVQVIDDTKGRTLVSATSFKKGAARSQKSVAAAKALGSEIAQMSLKAGIKEVVFDRGGSAYHGRIKALAEAARAAGLKF